MEGTYMENEFENESLGLRRLKAAGIFVGIILFGLIVRKVMIKVANGEEKKRPPIKAVVDTLVVSQVPFAQSVDIVGRTEALRHIDVVPEVSGVLKKGSRSFRIGTHIRKGQVLFRIDEGAARYDLLAQKSSFLNQLVKILPDIKIDFPDRVTTWEEYLQSFDPQKNIQALPKPASEKERYFLAARNILTNYYSIKSAEEQVSKFTVYAPFSGVITQAAVTEGSRVSMGQKIGAFSSGRPFEIRAEVPYSSLKGIAVGDTVPLVSIDNATEYTGKVTRINKLIESSSQSVLVYVQVDDASILEGTFMRMSFRGETFDKAVVIPSRFIYDGNRVAVHEADSTSYREVQILAQGNGYSTVLGLEDGLTVVRR